MDNDTLKSLMNYIAQEGSGEYAFVLKNNLKQHVIRTQTLRARHADEIDWIVATGSVDFKQMIERVEQNYGMSVEEVVRELD